MSFQQNWSMMPRVLLSVLFAILSGAALAAPDYAYLSGYAFLVNRDSPTISVVDLDALAVVDRLDIGVTPTVAAILPGARRLAVADGTSHEVLVYDIRAHEARRVGLQFAPLRVISSADGRRLAAIDGPSGRIAFVDPLSLRISATLELAPIVDAMFDGAWERLHVIQRGIAGYQTYDARSGQLLSATGALGQKHYSALSRSASGRELFARLSGSDEFDVVELVSGAHSAQRKLAGGRVYATGGGRFLLSIDEDSKKLLVDDAEAAAKVSSASWGAGEIYGAWFDTVAFVSRTDGPKLLAYDLEGRSVATVLDLPAAPGRGAVAADGARLLLPLPDARGLAVIDANSRAIAKIVPTDGKPVLALIAGAYGLCH